VLISVIINCYNGAIFLRRAIESVLSQGYKHFEIIVFDNCSTDESASIVENYLDSRIRLVSSELPEVVPLYMARNKAVIHARGSVLCFLDCDDLMLPGRLELMAEVFEKKDVDWLCTAYLKYSDEQREFSLHRQKNSGRIVSPGDLIERYNVGILTCGYRKKVFELLKFNSELTIIGDFIFNVACAAMFKGLYVEVPTAIYMEHGNNLSLTRKELWASELRKVSDLIAPMHESRRPIAKWPVTLGLRCKALSYYLDAVNPESRALIITKAFIALCSNHSSLAIRAFVVLILPKKILLFVKTFLGRKEIS